MSGSVLVKFDRARMALAEARSIDEVKQVRDQAEALRLYVRQQGESLEMQNDIAEIKLRAERRAGELLTDRPKARAGRPPDNWLDEQTDFRGAPTLSELGISRFQSHRWQAEASIPEEVFEQHVAKTKAAGKELTSTGTYRLARDLQREKEREEKAERGRSAEVSLDARFVIGDFREAMKELEPDSVDLIFTDPPYAEEYVFYYGDLAEIAARVLKPNGSLIVYAGHYALPAIFKLMCPHLRYWWQLIVKHSGGSARLPGKWVFVEYKPLLWFVKGGRRDNRYLSDVIYSNPPDKKDHDWQQDVAEAQYCIEHLTDENDLVVDPFCGSGTTTIAALRLNRSAWTCDVHEEEIAIAKGKVHDWHA